MTEEYPDNCLKGIPREEWVIGNSVMWTAFNPPSNSIPVNGWYESSINWELDKGAIVELRNREKNGQVHFKGGVVKVPRVEMDRIIEQFNIDKHFGYERKEEPNNKYHGNLLFNESLSKVLKATICGALSRAVSDLIRPED